MEGGSRRVRSHRRVGHGVMSGMDRRHLLARRGGVNLRVLLFLAVLLVPAIAIGYVAVRSSLSGGVRDLGDAYELDLKRMSSFAFNPVVGTTQDVPEQWRKFDGETVVLQGQMWAPERVEGDVKKFDLVYSIQDCCFTGEPKIQHFVKAIVPDGRAVAYHGRNFVRVRGKLTVDVTRGDAGRVNGVYHLAVDDVEPL